MPVHALLDALKVLRLLVVAIRSDQLKDDVCSAPPGRTGKENASVSLAALTEPNVDAAAHAPSSCSTLMPRSSTLRQACTTRPPFLMLV